MQKANSDLFVTEATEQRFLSIAPLIDTPIVDQAFLAHDKAAIRAKKQYHKLGQIAIVMIALSAIFTIAETLVLGGIIGGFLPTFIAALGAGLGIILQLYLIVTKQKPKWLLNRFAAERLRSLKFQSYALAHAVRDKSDLRERVTRYMTSKVSKLENDLNSGIAILRYFSPRQALEMPDAPKVAKDSRMSAAAREAYFELRVDYQRNFALSQVTRFGGRRRMFNSTQDMIYLGAAIFAFLSLGLKIAERFGFLIETGWIDFLAVTLFIVGATEAIMDNATLEEQSQTRYEQYARDIEDVKSKINQGDVSLVEVIADMEMICLDELDHFCRAADRISYRF